MSVTKKQHHIPRMLLKRFLDTDGYIFLGNVKKKKVERRNIESVGYINHLYSIDINGKNDDSLEKRFSIPESRANLILDKLESNIYGLTPSEINELIEFTVLLMYRSPLMVSLAAKHSCSEEIRQILLQSSIKNNFNTETAEAYFKQLKYQKGFAYSQVFTHVFKERYTLMVENFDLVLCDCSGFFPKFMLHDNYVTFDFIGRIPEIREDIKLWDLDLQIFCPLSKNLCLVFIPKKTNKGSKIFNFHHNRVNSEFMMNLNRKFVYNSASYIYCSCLLEAQRLISLRN